MPENNNITERMFAGLGELRADLEEAGVWDNELEGSYQAIVTEAPAAQTVGLPEGYGYDPLNPFKVVPLEGKGGAKVRQIKETSNWEERYPNLKKPTGSAPKPNPPGGALQHAGKEIWAPPPHMPYNTLEKDLQVEPDGRGGWVLSNTKALYTPQTMMEAPATGQELGMFSERHIAQEHGMSFPNEPGVVYTPMYGSESSDVGPDVPYMEEQNRPMATVPFKEPTVVYRPLNLTGRTPEHSYSDDPGYRSHPHGSGAGGGRKRSQKKMIAQGHGYRRGAGYGRGDGMGVINNPNRVAADTKQGRVNQTSRAYDASAIQYTDDWQGHGLGISWRNEGPWMGDNSSAGKPPFGPFPTGTSQGQWDTDMSQKAADADAKRVKELESRVNKLLGKAKDRVAEIKRGLGKVF